MDKEALRSMINNLINDRHEEATMDLHGYLTTKMKEVSGITSQELPPTNADGAGTDESDVTA